MITPVIHVKANKCRAFPVVIDAPYSAAEMKANPTTVVRDNCHESDHQELETERLGKTIIIRPLCTGNSVQHTQY